MFLLFSTFLPQNNNYIFPSAYSNRKVFLTQVHKLPILFKTAWMPKVNQIFELLIKEKLCETADLELLF